MRCFLVAQISDEDIEIAFSSSSNSDLTIQSRDSSFANSETFESQIRDFFLAFRFSITAYVHVIKNLESLKANVNDRKKSILNTTTIENKVPISIQIGCPSEDQSSSEPENFPVIIGRLSDEDEWIAIYEFHLLVRVVKDQSIGSNLKTTISKLENFSSPQSFLIQKPLTNSLLSNSTTQIRRIYAAEDIDRDALINIPQRLFFTSIRSIPLITLGYRLVQSGTFCGLDSIFLEIVALNNLNLAINEDFPLDKSLLSMELFSLRLIPTSLFITRLSDLDSFNLHQKSPASLSNLNQRSHLNSLECLKTPKTLGPGEIWSEVFCITASSFKMPNPALKRSESIFHTFMNGDMHESQLTNYGNDSKLTVVIEGIPSNQALQAHGPHSSSSFKPNLLEHRIDVDIMSLLELSRVPNKNPSDPNFDYQHQAKLPSINYNTINFIQTFGGFGEGSGINDSLNYKSVTTAQFTEGLSESCSSFISSLGFSESSDLPVLKFFPITAPRPHLPTNFMDKNTFSSIALQNTSPIIRSYSIGINQFQPIKVTVRNVPFAFKDSELSLPERRSSLRPRLGSVSFSRQNKKVIKSPILAILQKENSPLYNTIIRRNVNRPVPNPEQVPESEIVNTPDIISPNISASIYNLTSQFSPMLEKFNRITISDPRKEFDSETNQANSDFPLNNENNEDGFQFSPQAFPTGPLESSFKKIYQNQVKKNNARVKSDSFEDQNEEESDINKENLEDFTSFSELEQDLFKDKGEILVTIGSNPQARLGDTVYVTVSVFNTYPFPISGLSVSSSKDHPNDQSSEFLRELDDAGSRSSLKDCFGLEDEFLDLPFKSNILALDNSVSFRQIRPNSKETVTLKYLASDLEFCSIGNLYLFLSSEGLSSGINSAGYGFFESGSNSLEAETRTPDIFFGEKSNVHEKTLLAEFETPILIFVE
ncbi:hypothetical protein BB560_000191 [Smittium megazygosporum]|uniref:Uncharacterized protein n=1 Tax=Smittium megazygosporum TaxID=133381 RepID=A0A2T9ZL57_9FUNG|nr:hypothetical protein BB560_000191 [Smittium megazygosporum]